MLSRRQFLIGAAGAAAGLIVPGWVLRAERFIESEGRPYLQRPKRVRDTLHAIDWGDGNLQLFLGDPRQDPPALSWGEYAEHYFGMTLDEYVIESLELSLDEAARQGITVEAEAPEWKVLEQWVYHDSPSASAFRYLEGLPLGADFSRTGGMGSIESIDGPAPGNASRIVSVPDDLSLSLLQRRLNDLGEGVRIVVDTMA